MITGIRTLVFLAIFAGCCRGVIRYLKVETEMSLFAAAALVICVLFAAGVVHFLWPVTLLLYGFGALEFLLLLFELLRDREGRRRYRTAGLIFAVGAFAAAFAVTYGKMLVHCDNFTHWAVIAKSMIGRRALPDSSTAVSFRAYPPATAIWIYFVSKITGFSESNMMWAQRVLEICACTTLFGLLRLNGNKVYRRIMFLFLTGISVFAWGLIGYEFYSLLVDVTVPLLAGAVTMLLLRQQESGQKEALWVAVPGLIVLCLTKNSGFIFWIFVVILWAVNRKKVDRLMGAMIVAPFLFFGIWLLYVKAAYPAEANATMTNHAMTVENWMRVLSGKSWGDIGQIVRNYAGRTFSVRNSTTLIFAGFNLAALIWHRWMKKSDFVKSVLMGDLFLALYLIALLAMYIFSMEGTDAIELASYDRYYASVLIYMLFLYAHGFAKDLAGMEPVRYMRWSAGMFGAVLCFMIIAKIPMQYVYDSNSDMCVLRRKVQEELAGIQYLPGVQVATYSTWNEGVWLGSVTGYELSNYFNENWLTLPDEAELKQRLAEKEYFLIIAHEIPDSLYSLGITESGFYKNEGSVWVLQE